MEEEEEGEIKWRGSGVVDGANRLSWINSDSISLLFFPFILFSCTIRWSTEIECQEKCHLHNADGHRPSAIDRPTYWPSFRFLCVSVYAEWFHLECILCFLPRFYDRQPIRDWERWSADPRSWSGRRHVLHLPSTSADNRPAGRQAYSSRSLYPTRVHPRAGQHFHRRGWERYHGMPSGGKTRPRIYLARSQQPEPQPQSRKVFSFLFKNFFFFFFLVKKREEEKKRFNEKT